jgi:hypothetical protein
VRKSGKERNDRTAVGLVVSRKKSTGRIGQSFCWFEL